MYLIHSLYIFIMSDFISPTKMIQWPPPPLEGIVI